MRVILVNGSPKKEGCTFTALSEVEKALQAESIQTQIFQLSDYGAIEGCRDCRYCHKNEGYCIVGDFVNDFIALAKEADGFIFGTPVYYASASGQITSFMDRVFFSNFRNGNTFRGKPVAAIASCRRGGSTAALDQLNKYFTISQMPVVSSQYWNMVHGNTPDEVRKDEEGMQIMRTLGKNMAWLLKAIEAGRAVGIDLPPEEKIISTNFIR